MFASEAVWPKQINEATAAYRYLTQEMDILPTVIIVGGDSSGEHLVLSLLHNIQTMELSKPAAALLLCPWVKLLQSGASVSTNKFKDIMKTGSLDEAANMVLGARGRTVFNHLLNFAVPQPRSMTWKDVLPEFTWINVGSHDLFLDDIGNFAANSENDGADVELEVSEGGSHGWQSFVDHATSKKYCSLMPEVDATGLMPGAENIAEGILGIYRKIQNSPGR